MSTTLQFPVRDRATPAESAKILKQALRSRFPATAFSVRLSRGTGYGNCYISWTDGPTVALVEQVTAKFEGKGFDGMTDSSYHKDTRLPDGRESGLGLILEQRYISPALARIAAAQVAAFYGVTAPTVLDATGGYWKLANDAERLANADEYWTTLIHRAASDASRYRREAL